MTTAELTDLWNAERLIEQHAENLRHVGPWKKGLAWDGQRWLIDETGHWDRAAIQTVRSMLDEAAETFHEAKLAESDEELSTGSKQAKGRFAWAVKSQSAKALNSMRSLAQKAENVDITHEVLDADPWLLNVQNGTIDLRTGELREHRREDLITKLAPTDYDPDAQAPTWLTFLDRVMAGNADLISFLQRLIGYTLTGSVQEHVLGFFFGGGANGKSTFLGTIHAMMGDYARPAARGLLFRSKGERHPTELASLHGRRFVTCSEIQEGESFDEALVKDLTGGDPINARRMREDEWTFQPSHKLFLAGQHKPTVRGDDEGIWRRMLLVPWAVQIPKEERDTLLKDRLRVELPGILRWAVAGCLAWQLSGLQSPMAVADATSQYREEENDVLGEFLRTRIVFGGDATISRKELREVYETHCKDGGSEPFGAKRFTARLREMGVKDTTVRRPAGFGPGTKVMDGWRGCRLASDSEREAASAWGKSATDVVTCSDPACVEKSDVDTASDVGTTGHYITATDDGSLAFFNESQGISR